MAIDNKTLKDCKVVLQENKWLLNGEQEIKRLTMEQLQSMDKKNDYFKENNYTVLGNYTHTDGKVWVVFTLGVSGELYAVTK